jgi:hypothetical protein
MAPKLTGSARYRGTKGIDTMEYRSVKLGGTASKALLVPIRRGRFLIFERGGHYA